MVVFTAAVLLGCAQMSADEIAKKIQEKWDSVTDYGGLQKVTITVNGRQTITELRVYIQKTEQDVGV